MRIAIFLYLYVLFAVQALASSAADQISWPDRGPFLPVGQAGYGAGVVLLPAPVVAAVRRQVRGQPATWYVTVRVGFAKRKARVACIAGLAAERCLLLDRGTWSDLNAPANLGLVNTLLGTPPADWQDRPKLRACHELWRV